MAAANTRLMFLIVVVASIAAEANTGEDSLSVLPLELGSLGHAAQPNITTLADGEFLLSWQARLPDGCHALRMATLSSSGKLGTIHEAARGCHWFVNWADFPSVAVADNGDWVTFWLEKSGSGTYAYDIRLSRSTDQGKTFSAPITPHNDGTPTEHGFVAMAPAGADKILLVWLDGRHTGGPHDHDHDGGHDGHDDASGEHHSRMTLRSAVVGRDLRLVHEHQIDGDVCSCCPTDLVRIAAREHRVLYRDRSTDNVRNIAVQRFDGRHWHDEGQVHDDGWKIAGCPVNGPALAHSGRSSLAVWSTMGATFGGAEAGTPDDGLSVRARILGADPIELERNAGTLGRVDAVAVPSGWLISWLGAGADKQTSSLRLGHFDAHLVELNRIDLSELPSGRDIGMPRMASSGNTAVVVWTEATDAKTRRLAGRLLSVNDRRKR